MFFRMTTFEREDLFFRLSYEELKKTTTTSEYLLWWLTWFPAFVMLARKRQRGMFFDISYVWRPYELIERETCGDRKSRSRRPLAT